MRSTRRLPVALGAAVLAVAVLGACSGGGRSGGSASDGKAVPIGGGSTVSPAPPGKYQTLPEPCTAVDPDMLKTLVPAAKDLSGTEALTYDTDRRVGCSWTGRSAAGTSDTLTIDMERVVSYDPAVSAEVQAGADFDNQAGLASIPPDAGSSPTTTPTSTGTPTTTGDAAGGASTDGTGSGGSSPDLAPRRLPDVGNAAFIDDVLKAHSPAAPRRDVTLVFRTANVLVRITYSETSPRGGKQPSSADMQQGAQQVADQLERKVEH